MRLFKLDEVDDRLELLPMAARRSLDSVGLKLSLSVWKQQSHSFRSQLTDLGSPTLVDVPAVMALLAPLHGLLTTVTTLVEPEANAVPELVREAFGRQRPIPDPSWAALSALERYVLVKVAERGRRARLDQAYAELIGASALSSHLEPQGGVRMVNVGEKAATARSATVESRVIMNAAAFERLRKHDVPKGDVLGTARIAGIMAAKKTSDWIPLCHPVQLTRISLELELDVERHCVRVLATVEARDRTGVEMEALVAASAASLTVYDMLKSFDRGMQIGPTRLLEKSGGRSGTFRADGQLDVASTDAGGAATAAAERT